jgi:very-short-patch-repair endonuclease
VLKLLIYKFQIWFVPLRAKVVKNTLKGSTGKVILNQELIRNLYVMKFLEPTIYEKILGDRLRRRSIPYKSGPVIWFTRADYYTPDLVLGNKLIVEVDGSIHDLEARKTPDRIRHRALENLGYFIIRVRNERIRTDVDAVVEEIIQRY